MSGFPLTLDAVRSAERSGYEVSRALWIEVPKTPEGVAKRGELKKAAEFLANNEVGGGYSERYLSDLHRVGGWLASSGSEPDVLMPPRYAMEAMKQKLTADEAVAQWQLGPDEGDRWTLRKWAEALGRKWSDVRDESAQDEMERAVENFGEAAVRRAYHKTVSPVQGEIKPEPVHEPTTGELMDTILRLVTDLGEALAAFKTHADTGHPDVQAWSQGISGQLTAMAAFLDVESVTP